VIETHKCPPCPPGAQCKPCLGDYIVITDNLDEKDPVLVKRLRVFTDKPEQFDLKTRYRFLVRVRGKLREGHAMEEVDLIRFEPVKEE